MSTAYLHPGDRVHIAVPVSPTHRTLADAMSEGQKQADGMAETFAANGVTVVGWSSHSALSHPVVVAVFRTPAAVPAVTAETPATEGADHE